MIQGFMTHGILLCMVFVHGFWPILILGIFGPFWREWGYVTINAQLPCIYGVKNNNFLDHFWWNFSCEGQNEGNVGGIMMHIHYGLDHRYIGENFWVLIIIGYDLTSSMSKFSSSCLLLSSTPKVSTPPRLRVVLLQQILILLVFLLRLMWLLILCHWILSRLVSSLCSLNFHFLLILHQLCVHCFLIMAYIFTTFTVQISWCT